MIFAKAIQGFDSAMLWILLQLDYNCSVLFKILYNIVSWFPNFVELVNCCGLAEFLKLVNVLLHIRLQLSVSVLLYKILQEFIINKIPANVELEEKFLM